MNLLELFLKHKSITDVKRKVSGELFELSLDEATYFYGNGELIISPNDSYGPECIYVVDTYGDKFYLVEF